MKLSEISAGTKAQIIRRNGRTIGGNDRGVAAVEVTLTGETRKGRGSVYEAEFTIDGKDEDESKWTILHKLKKA